MKFISRIAVLSALLLLLGAHTSRAQFHHGGSWLGPLLTLATNPIGFGVNFEHGVSENIGVGGLVRYWGESVSTFGVSYSWSIIMPQGQVAYHFMPGDQLDPFAGGRLGWAIYSVDSVVGSAKEAGGIFLTAYGGLRYFFSPTVSGVGTLEFRVAGEDYFGSSIQLSLGVDFTL
jgi:hypothetical protein